MVTLAAWLEEQLDNRRAAEAQQAERPSIGPLDIAREIHDERLRQVAVEGYSAEHDDEHVDGSLAMAAATYATPELLYRFEDFANEKVLRDSWPWDRRFDKRHYSGNVVRANGTGGANRRLRRRLLIIAAALIMAEIERLDRLTVRETR